MLIMAHLKEGRGRLEKMGEVRRSDGVTGRLEK